MAFARVKVQWAKMDTVKLVTEGPLAGKEHRTPERLITHKYRGSQPFSRVEYSTQIY